MFTPYDNNRFDKLVAEGTALDHLEKRSRFGSDRELEQPTFYRMVVLEVIFDPTTIDQTTAEYYEHDLGVSNPDMARALPRNSIIAKRVTDGTQSAGDRPMFLFPFFPSHLSLPCKVGEHVWAIFESPQKVHDLGYWMCRVPVPGYVDDVNHSHAPREFDPTFTPGTRDKGSAEPKYEFRNGIPDDDGNGGRVTRPETAYIDDDDAAYERLRKETNASAVTTYESVPRYKKRPADMAFEGTNNTLIVLGQDRTGPAAKFSSDQQKGSRAAAPDGDQRGDAGAIDIVVGRGQTQKTGGTPVDNTLNTKEIAKAPASKLAAGEGDPDFVTDRSRIYIAQRTSVDKNFALDKFNGDKLGIKDGNKGDGATVIKSDKVRIVGREDIEVIVIGFERDNDGRAKDGTDASKYVVIALDGSTGKIHVQCKDKVTIVADTVDVKANTVLIGDGADAHLVRFEDLKNDYDNHIHPTGVGPSDKPVKPLGDNVKSKNNKVK